MSNDVHIEIPADVREQLRKLDTTLKEEIVEALYSHLPTDGRRIPLPGQRLHLYKVGQFVFFYRELTAKELARTGKEFGYYVFDMKDVVKWIRGRFDS